MCAVSTGSNFGCWTSFSKPWKRDHRGFWNGLSFYYLLYSTLLQPGWGLGRASGLWVGGKEVGPEVIYHVPT
ncbi:hypothetical protein BJY00DRAFT_155792 [Aspergillus carlsbadensis]|nr:hypothetical protein BJY00DRAFT_155792 [Aspergillus carlsbadensis]